jgi:hypothetical protein
VPPLQHVRQVRKYLQTQREHLHVQQALAALRCVTVRKQQCAVNTLLSLHPPSATQSISVPALVLALHNCDQTLQLSLRLLCCCRWITTAPSLPIA